MLAIFWAFRTIESGSGHIDNQQFKELESKNNELEKEVADLKSQINSLIKEKELTLSSSNDAQLPEVTIPTQEAIKPVEQKPVVAVLKYQSLINELQKIVNSKIILKKGSQGIMVGSIQKFFNIYNKTSLKIDNDYGVSTVTTITNFQKDQGIAVSGDAGVTTISKMIDWLKKQ